MKQTQFTYLLKSTGWLFAVIFMLSKSLPLISYKTAAEPTNAFSPTSIVTEPRVGLR